MMMMLCGFDLNVFFLFVSVCWMNGLIFCCDVLLKFDGKIVDVKFVWLILMVIVF